MIKTYISGWLKFVIWISFTILFLTTGIYFFPFQYALIGALVSSGTFIGVLLINEYWLFPKYFIENRRRFIIINLIVIFILTGLNFFLDTTLTPRELSKFAHTAKMEMPIYFPILRSFGMVSMANFISITLLLATELKRKAENEKFLKEEKLGTEIKLLKAQINPHFIFNALNNIYSLTYTKSEMAPESILKLSEMLRYVFYDCSNDVVKLDAEIEYISNFIAFQQMKSEHEQSISFDNSKVRTDIDIAPMLFIPFIENAFKYSKVEEVDKAYVNINLSSEKNALILEIENSIPNIGKILSGNGLGIKNVRQRLDLLYPNKYSLDIYNSDDKFTVKLKINS
ncbi:MAG: histidine kinase [Bacteroidales bacterium]|nr:histidine kinase [Bacteroidales bacterium]